MALSWYQRCGPNPTLSTSKQPTPPPQPLGQGYQQYRLQQGGERLPGLTRLPEARLSEGITLSVKGRRRRGRGVTGEASAEPRGRSRGELCHLENKAGSALSTPRPLLCSRRHLTSHRTCSAISLRRHPHCLTRPGLRRRAPYTPPWARASAPRGQVQFHKTRPPPPGRVTPWPGREGAAGDKAKASPPGPPAFLPSSALRAPAAQARASGGAARPGSSSSSSASLHRALRLSPRGLALLEAWPPWVRLLSTKLPPDLPSPSAFLLLGPRGPQPRLTPPSPPSAP